MKNHPVVEEIRERFKKYNGTVQIPLLKGGQHFVASVTEEGINVSNLGNQPLLPWEVFIETINLLERKGGKAERGNYTAKLGKDNLPLDSVEGHIAHVVYGKKIGDSVFRRITPVACILIWAGLCYHNAGHLVLAKEMS